MSFSTQHFSRRTIIGFVLLCIPLIAIIWISIWLYHARGLVFSYVLPNTGDQVLLSRPDMVHMRDVAQIWLWKDFNAKGYFNYEYDPRTGAFATSTNIIDELMASRMLAEKASQSSLFKKAHQQNLDYIFAHGYTEKDGKGYMVYGGEADLGANGVLLLVLAESPNYQTYKAKGDALAAAILASQKENGELDPVLIPNPKVKYTTKLLSYYSYYSAEAIIGLFGWYEKTGDTKYRDAAIKAQDFYMNKYLVLGSNNSLLLHWQILSLSRAYGITHDTKYRDAILAFCDVLINLQKMSDKEGGSISPFTVLSSSIAVNSEAFARGYLAAKEAGDSARAEQYRTAALLGVYKLGELQYKVATDTAPFAYPEPLMGGVRNALDDSQVRLDGVVQSISALNLIIQTF